jgi:hypothetical protein
MPGHDSIVIGGVGWQCRGIIGVGQWPPGRVARRAVLLVVTHLPAAVSIGEEHRYVRKPSSAHGARR